MLAPPLEAQPIRVIEVLVATDDQERGHVDATHPERSLHLLRVALRVQRPVPVHHLTVPALEPGPPKRRASPGERLENAAGRGVLEFDETIALARPVPDDDIGDEQAEQIVLVGEAIGVVEVDGVRSEEQAELRMAAEERQDIATLTEIAARREERIERVEVMAALVPRRRRSGGGRRGVGAARLGSVR